MELDGYGVAELDLCSVLNEVAGGIGGDGVAAFEHAERAALFQLDSQTLEALALGAQEALGADTEIGAVLFDADGTRKFSPENRMWQYADAAR